MMLLSHVLPAVLAASSLVHAASVPRGYDKFSRFIHCLDDHDMSILARNYERVSRTEEGKPVVDMIETGGKLTILAPDNSAFQSGYTKIGPYGLLYNMMPGTLDEGSGNGLTRRAKKPSQSRSIKPSGAGMSGGGQRKRAKAQYQVQVVFQSFDKKRMSNKIEIDGPVGTTEVGDSFECEDNIVLSIPSVLATPEKPSALLEKPLADEAPEGFTKFAEELRKAEMMDDVDECDLITLFAPLNESLKDIDNMSTEEKKQLLQNHYFCNNRVFSTSFPEGQKATAASGKELQFSVENGADYYVSCGETKAQLLRSDVPSENGVLHVIDRPLKC